MSLTDEFKDLIDELAIDLGEGLTATLIQFPSTSTFDPATQSYSDAAAVEQTFACSPPSAAVGTTAGMPEVQRGILSMVIPTVDEDGDAMTPRTGDRLRINSVIYQIVSADPLMIGTGTAGYQCEVRQ